MKKLALLTMALLSIATLSFSQVDHSLEFVDKDGNVVADGSVITRNEVEEDPFGDGSQINSGLYAKNTTDGVVNFGFVTTIVTMPSGSFSHCFPGNCKNTSAPVSNSVDERKVGGVNTSLKAGETQSLVSEWCVEDGNYGTTTVTYQFKIYEVDAATFDYKFKADGPKVTVNYVYADPAGIQGITADEATKSEELYDLNGKKVVSPVDGKIYVSKNKKYIYHK